MAAVVGTEGVEAEEEDGRVRALKFLNCSSTRRLSIVDVDSECRGGAKRQFRA